MFFPPLQLFITVDEKSTADILHKTIERFTWRTHASSFMMLHTVLKSLPSSASLTSAIANSLLSWRRLRWISRHFAQYQSSSATRSPSLAVVSTASNPFRSSIRFHYSAVEQILWCPSRRGRRPVQHPRKEHFWLRPNAHRYSQVIYSVDLPFV